MSIEDTPGQKALTLREKMIEAVALAIQHADRKADIPDG